jgi:hypothetical protein
MGRGSRRAGPSDVVDEMRPVKRWSSISPWRRPRRRSSMNAENLTARAGRGSVVAMTTDERLTWEQICERYPEQWVLLVDHERLPHDVAGFKSARVLAVGRSRAEAKERARPQLESYYRWGCHFTGPVRGPRFGYRPWFIP